MYESFYKLHPTPFRLTPDPHFFFESETHKRGLAYLRFAFYQREGFVAITGAPGTGKTELMLNMIEELPDEKVTLAKIVTTNLDADDLLDLVAASFQIDSEHISKGSELKRLEDFFFSQARIGKQVLLIIDEAHNLSARSLLELSMLENFQLKEKPVMQCFLLGQLPLEEKLNLPELEPLKQRVIASARLEALDQQETREYIIHRLSRSGWDNNPVIHDEAFSIIHLYTKGVPRKINSLCNRLLLHTYLEDQHEIVANTVHTVIQEVQHEAVKESLDVDFADLQEIMKSSAGSQQDNEKQSSLSKKNKAQKATVPQKKNKAGKRKSPDDEIFIPEFIKKTQNQNSSSPVKVLKDIPAPEREELQWGDTASIAKKQSHSRQEASITQSAANVVSTKHVAQQTAHGSGQLKEANVATAKHVAYRPANRPSGLLDKELQFLTSLVESTPPPTTSFEEPKAKDTPRPVIAEKQGQKSATLHEVIIDESVNDEDELTDPHVRKIIIDDSLYEHDEHNNLVDSNSERDWRKPWITIPTLLDDWRHTALAASVLGILIVSISWLHNGNSDSANIAADNQTEINSSSENLAEVEIFSNGAPVDIELPVIDSPIADTESTHEAGSETSDTIPTNATAAETPTSATDTASITDISNSASNLKSSELDAQLTQILEQSAAKHTTPADTGDNGTITTAGHDTQSNDNTESGVSNESDAQIRSTALSLAKAGTSPKPAKPVPEKNITESQERKTTTVKTSTSPDADDRASTSQANKPRSVAMQKNNSDSALFTSLLQAPKILASPSVIPRTQASDATGRSVAMLNTYQDSVSPRSKQGISSADLTTLLSRLSNAYENGNLQQLVSTFALDIESSDGSNRREMLKEYQRLFTITDKRQLTIQDVKWSTKDKQVLGKGNFEVSIREKGATKPTRYQGKISFAVARELDTVVIKKLDYDYGQ